MSPNVKAHTHLVDIDFIVLVAKARGIVVIRLTILRSSVQVPVTSCVSSSKTLYSILLHSTHLTNMNCTSNSNDQNYLLENYVKGRHVCGVLKHLHIKFMSSQYIGRNILSTGYILVTA